MVKPDTISEFIKSPVGAQQLYQKLPVLEPNTIRYVEFCPAEGCDFDPDLLFFVSDFPQADIIMRATSYISGDLWESKSSPVISCAWMYAYPVISGKVNHITTGFYHGLKRRKAYPAGLRMISIPYQKLPEFFAALGEMDWTTIGLPRGRGKQEGTSAPNGALAGNGRPPELKWICIRRMVPAGRGGRQYTGPDIFIPELIRRR